MYIAKITFSRPGGKGFQQVWSRKLSTFCGVLRAINVYTNDRIWASLCLQLTQ